MEVVGNVIETGKVTFVWKVGDFFQLSDLIDKCYYSPEINFSGALWRIGLYPNGRTINTKEGWINVTLGIQKCESLVNVKFTFSIKTDGENAYTRSHSVFFHKDFCVYGINDFILKSELIEKKQELLPSNILTIICTLESDKEIDIADSEFRRHQDICHNLLGIYSSERKTDLELKFNDGESIHAHQVILESRSPVFKAMINPNPKIKEKQVDVIAINDVNRNIMNDLLECIYCGHTPTLTTENALPLYAAAKKYEIEYVKVVCLQFIDRNLSVDWVTDVITFAELNSLEEVSRCARKYFKENADEILESAKWKNFAKENKDQGMELLSSLERNPYFQQQKRLKKNK